jgi:hypothetical protein
MPATKEAPVKASVILLPALHRAAKIAAMDQGINWKTAVQSALIALLGAVAKDYNVSGTAASSKDVASK